MDLRLFVRVLWRFRVLVAIGLTLSLVLAVLSFARLGLDGIRPTFEYRSAETWSSTATLLVTEPGFPVGRSILQEDPASAEKRTTPEFSDPTRFNGLAVVYARLIQGDAVRRLVSETGPEDPVYGAEPVRTPEGVMPFIDITALADSPAQAKRLARRVTTAFQTYLARRQAVNGIPADRRVEVPVVTKPDTAVLFEGRSKTKPILILFLGFSLTFVLAFVLENVRPRTRLLVTPIHPASVEASPERIARTG